MTEQQPKRARPPHTARRRAAAALATLLSATLLAGCSSSSLPGWAAAADLSGNDALLRSDIAHLRAGIARHELQAVRTACEAFAADASNADGQLPTPDATLTTLLNRAYEDFYRAGEDCYAAPSFTSTPFRRFQAQLAAGEAALDGALSRYRALAGHPPPPAASGASGGS